MGTNAAATLRTSSTAPVAVACVDGPSSLPLSQPARPPPPTVVALIEPSRTYIDSQGIQWRVVERLARRSPHEEPRPCLFFEAPHIIRRVCRYPDEWRTLADAELEALSWRL